MTLHHPILNRRTMLAGAAATAVQLAMDGAARAGTLNMTRIDTHHHFIPPELVKAVGAARLAASTPYGRMPQWSPENAQATCDTLRISKAILSISPGYAVEDQSKEPETMHACNEAAARLRDAHPVRFGHFASIPLFYPAKALTEIEHALDVLKSDGVIVASNYDGRYLGDSNFGEVWQELDRRNAIVFIHPSHPPYNLGSLPPESVLEYPFETTRTATSLVFSGVTQRYRKIKFILSHAGGTLPYIASRIAGGAQLDPKVRERIDNPLEELRSFWFDTALSGNPTALSALLNFADHSRIIFGSDFPYAPTAIIQSNINGQEALAVGTDLLSAIMYDNANRLFSKTIPVS